MRPPIAAFMAVQKQTHDIKKTFQRPDLTMSALEVFATVAAVPGITPGNITQVTDIEPGSVAKILRTWTDRGLMASVPDENDARSKRFYLTKVGLKAAKEVGMTVNGSAVEETVPVIEPRASRIRDAE